MPSALDNFPYRKIKLLEPKAANFTSTVYYQIANLKHISRKKHSSVKMQYCLQYLAHQQQWNFRVFLGTCEILKFDPTTKLLNAENSPGGIAVAIAGT